VSGPEGSAADAGSGTAAQRAERVRDSYRRQTGEVPALIEDRIAVAQRTGRLEAIEAIEALRQALIAENQLGEKNQQLVHFGQLVVLAQGDLARRHAAAARRAGATPAELMGVAETALITAGIPAYNLGMSVLTELFATDERA
jgi:4-carboxymuconolactone decarboxylase